MERETGKILTLTANKALQARPSHNTHPYPHPARYHPHHARRRNLRRQIVARHGGPSRTLTTPRVVVGAPSVLHVRIRLDGSLVHERIQGWSRVERETGKILTLTANKALQARPSHNTHNTWAPFLRRVPKLSTRSAVPRLVANLSRNEKEKAGATSQQSNVSHMYYWITTSYYWTPPPRPPP